MLIVFHYVSVYIVNTFKIFDSINFDCLTGNRQKCQNFSLLKFSAYGISYEPRPLWRTTNIQPLSTVIKSLPLINLRAQGLSMANLL